MSELNSKKSNLSRRDFLRLMGATISSNARNGDEGIAIGKTSNFTLISFLKKIKEKNPKETKTILASQTLGIFFHRILKEKMHFRFDFLPFPLNHLHYQYHTRSFLFLLLKNN